VAPAVAGSVGLGGIAPVIAGALADSEDVLADGVVLWEPHPASVMAAVAAQATSATEEYPRKKFTVVTLHPRHAIPARGYPAIAANSWATASNACSVSNSICGSPASGWVDSLAATTSAARLT
jgi:hypothetical protein